MADVMEALAEAGLTIREVGHGGIEFYIGVPGDQEYNVFRGSDDGSDPDGWYVEIGDQVDGPWETFDDLVADAFLGDY
jgi:hypothetical protein